MSSAPLPKPATLADLAADYRVLQLQNASLHRQLADLEAVLQAYHREDGPVIGTATPRATQQGDAMLQRVSDQARTILARAHKPAEGRAGGESLRKTGESVSPIEIRLKELDVALVEIPALPCE